MRKTLAFVIAFIFTMISVLTPVILVTDVPSSTAQNRSAPAYEFDVLSGLQDDPITADGLYLTCGWHTSGCGGTDDHENPRALDMDWSDRTNPAAAVHAIFRHVHSDDSAEFYLKFEENMVGYCSGVDAEVLLFLPGSSEDLVVADIGYLHITPAEKITETIITLSKGITKVRLGKLIAAESSGCEFDGAHLHQVDRHGEAVLNQSTASGKGMPIGMLKRDKNNNPINLCISTSMWLMKIASTAPAVTATDTPTTVCPPTELKMIAGSSLDLEFVASRIVRLELYKTDSNGEFCDADAASCTPKTTVGDATETLASFGAQPSGKYRARGRICVGSICSVWSRSDTIDHIAPPTGLALKSSRDGQLGVYYARVDIPDAGWHEFALYQAAMDGQFCDVCDALTTVPQPATRATPGENTEAPTLFGLQPERAYKARARSCRSGGPGPGGVPADNCGAWSDFTPVIYHIRPPAEMGLVSSNGNLGVSFKSLRAARFQLYRSSGSACTVGAAGCTLVATITAEASASAGPHTATFGQRAGGTYWVRGQSCLTSGAGGSGGVGGAAGTPGPRVATGACGAWSALSPEFTHRVPSFGTSRVSDQSWTKGLSVSLTLPAATGGDGNLTYTLTPEFPLNVTRNERNGRTFSGAPNAAKTRTMHTWTATDENGDKDSITFYVTVNAAPAPPPTVTPTPQCTLTVHASPQKGGTVSDNTTVDCSSSTNLTAEANPKQGYRFLRWSGDGTGTGASERTVTMSTDRSVTAHFEPTLACDGSVFVFEVGRSSSKTLSAARDGSGTITYSDGTGRPTWLAFDAPTHAVSGTPPRAGAWLFSTLSTDADGNKAYCPHLVEGKKIPYTVNATVSPNTAWGSVTKSPAGPYYYGNSVTLTANANPGYRFVRWSGAASDTSTTARVTVTGTVSVTAKFEKTYALSVSVTKTARGYLHGSVTRTPWKAVYAYNDRVTLTANANPGYRFVRWSGAASGTSTTARVTMNGDKTVKAHFELIPLPPCDPSVPGSCACPPSFPICGNAEDEGG